MAAFIPVDTVAGFALANFIAWGLIVAVCFLAGLAAKRPLTRRMVAAIETRMLSKVPGYAFVKGVAQGLEDDGESAAMRPVFMRLDDALS
jgi:hypothetical protein